MNKFRAGVDIGGTFTDIVLLGDRGERHTKKVSSTVDDYARAITEGLAELLAEIGGAARGIGELLHGTTVASNAILEHKGAKTGLITTKGFRDVLEIRNLHGSTTCRGPSHRPWSSGACGSRSTSGSTPRAASTGRSTRRASSAPCAFCSTRGSRRSRSASCTRI
jgi:hypothetical protein